MDGVKRKVAACTLDKPTQDLVKLIFDNDMFKEAMQTFHIGKYFDGHCRLSLFHYTSAAYKRTLFIYFVQTELDLFIHCPLVDVKKMPLGKLSKTQIAKGFEALEEIQAAVEGLYLNTPLPHLPKNLKTLPHSCTRLD